MTFINKDKTLCFVHIPKAGGRSVTSVLKHYERGHPGGLHFTKVLATGNWVFKGRPVHKVAERVNFSLSSEGHIPYHVLQNRFPDAHKTWRAFTVVREPLARIKSGFLHISRDPALNGGRWIERGAGYFTKDQISYYIDALEEIVLRDCWSKEVWWEEYKVLKYGHPTPHIVPQTFFVDVDDAVELFPMSNLGAVKEFILNDKPDTLNIDFPHIGKSGNYDITFNAHQESRLRQIYAEDFKLWSKAINSSKGVS